MEIYNEQIADLLVGRSSIPGNKGLAVREDTSGNIHVVDLKEECVTDESKVYALPNTYVLHILVSFMYI